MTYARIKTDLLVVDLRDAVQDWERAGDEPSADAGCALAEAALAVCDAYDSLPARVTLSDVGVLGSLVRAAWEHQLVAWLSPSGVSGLVWGTARAIVQREPSDPGGVADPADDSVDLRDCVLWVTTHAGREVYLPMAQAMDDAKASRFVTNYNPHPEAHGPGVWCGGCPKMAPLKMPPIASEESEMK